jgi:hypothetical protein
VSIIFSIRNSVDTGHLQYAVEEYRRDGEGEEGKSRRASGKSKEGEE